VDYDLTEEQRILQKSARDFLKKECPKALIRDLAENDEGHSPELWKKMADMGWMGLMLPEVYGGSGWTFQGLVLLLEEMGYNLCPGPFFATTVLCAPAILDAGSESQKQDLLSAVSNGEEILTLAWAEGTGGFDVASTEVTATLEGDEWVINGAKLFVPDAQIADHMLCVAGTQSESGSQAGVTLFLVPKNASGLSCDPLKTVGWDKQYKVVFDQVRIPLAHVIGAPHGAGAGLVNVMEMAAVGRCAEMIGHAQAAMDMTITYAKERVQFDRPIGSFQAVQHRFADMWLDIHMSRNLVHRAAWKISQGMPAAGEAAMAKMRVGKTARKATQIAHQLFGAIGFTMEHDLHLYHRRVLAGDMAFGNSDYQEEKVAKHLGL